MKTNFLTILLCCFILMSCKKDNTPTTANSTIALPSTMLKASTSASSTLSLKVLQLNVWQEGTKVSGGFNGIIDAIVQSGADLITLSEVRNYNNTNFSARVLAALSAKNLTFYSFKDNNVGIISRYPIVSFKTGIYGNAFDKAVINLDLNTQVAIYSAHLDYLNYACYLQIGRAHV